MNEDGLSDLIIAAYLAAPGNRINAGSSFVVFGASSGYGAVLELSSLNGTNGFRVNGALAGDTTNAVASVGDMNGDGLSDLIIGASLADPGNRTNAGSSYLIFGDSLDLFTPALTINQGETILLDNSMLAAWHPHNLAINASIPFRITNVVHGSFSMLNFLQSNLSQNSISFTHDGSIYAPSFEVAAGNWAVAGPVRVTINFNAPPVLTLNPFSVGQGKTVILTNQSIRATSVYHSPDALIFNVSNVLYGNFVKTNTTVVENQFNQSVLNQGQISFEADGSANTPSYDISVSDGISTTSIVHGIVNFNAAPVLLSNRVTLKPGQLKVILSSDELSASDAEISLGELIFTPSTLNCHFENLNLPGISLPSFLQKNIQGSQIIFVWDNHTVPAYNMSVSDGVLSVGRPASITIISDSNTTTVTNITNTVISTETTNTNGIIGGVVGAVAGLGLLFGLQWYLKKKTNEQFQKILSESTSDAEKTFNEDVVRPIAKKIFDNINTTGCFGRRSEANTKAYMIAIGKIILALRQQNANLDFNAMEPVEKESFINEIANQTRQQSLPKNRGFFASCTRYCSAESTPQEIEYAAEDIAVASAAWQKRHMSAVTAKTSSDIELNNPGKSRVFRSGSK